MFRKWSRSVKESRANRFISRTINKRLDIVLSKDEGLENLHDLRRSLEDFPKPSITLCFLCNIEMKINLPT